MRRSRQETAETRQRIVDTASTEFRRNGIAATGLAPLMAAAGLTHGGFYKHFGSKEQVVEESVAHGIDAMVVAMDRILQAAPGERGLRSAIEAYLSPEHRDAAAGGCPLAALGSELARGPDAVRAATTAGLLKMVDTLAAQFEGVPPAAARKEALWIFTAMVGAVTMARAVDDPDLSATILRQARSHLVRPS
ncbi:TetR/AcrR family transcriptional regulator [Pseudorhodoferax sp.]|uniref:TetR/AcrR family transcriptional regulator n=1 Tax=Pseudorhodoferax sp. TaxID=1993553 RepID=UPI002DD6B296|nr:TetR/AcrR family transcriptional regulator [Pseudorhodoferax sp.]